MLWCFIQEIIAKSKLNFFKDFIYLSERERDRAQAGGEAEAEGEAGSPLSKEPDAGLDPRTLGS